MGYVVTVSFDTDVTNIEAAEGAHPEVMDAISQLAEGRMTSNTRYFRDGFTMDVDEYQSELAYREFMAEAAPLIKRYGELVGAEPVFTSWQRYGD